VKSSTGDQRIALRLHPRLTDITLKKNLNAITDALLATLSHLSGKWHE